jgi:glycosyltransferase involved in cell wall biosynthesis
VAKPSVLITFDSMKYPNSGFFSFGKSLGDALIKQNRGRYSLYYYVHTRATYLFNKKVSLVFLSKLHKFFFPEPNRFALTHFTDQYCRLKPKKIKSKKIITVHDINVVHEGRKPDWKVQRDLNRLRENILVCDKVVAISKFVADDIIKYYPEVADRVSVIYNGADVLTVDENHSPNYLPSNLFLFAIGYIAPKKNFHVLPALLQGNDYELVISGVETPYRDKIIEEAVKFGCADRVKITGPVSEEDKAWYYENCAAFVFPSIAEGFGLPVIEAMHFGKPVFLSTATSLPEIGGDAAFYFENFEPGSMQQVFAKGMEQFVAEKWEDKVKAHARQFNWDETAKQYLALYEDCL